MESDQNRGRSMKIALLGYGKMGKLVESLALAQGHEIVAIIDSKEKLSELKRVDFDIGIDFTSPETVKEHVAFFGEINKNLVVGTTGWEEHLHSVKASVAQSQIGLLYSPNFSIGVSLFKLIVEAAGKIIGQTKRYDAAGMEAHHRQKVDAPSGTAKLLQHALHSQGWQIPFNSLRCGHIPGTHTIHFDSPEDSITLTHTARNREGFAHGALVAAEWLRGKQGFFTLDDMIGELYNEAN